MLLGPKVLLEYRILLLYLVCNTTAPGHTSGHAVRAQKHARSSTGVDPKFYIQKSRSGVPGKLTTRDNT